MFSNFLKAVDSTVKRTLQSSQKQVPTPNNTSPESSGGASGTDKGSIGKGKNGGRGSSKLSPRGSAGGVKDIARRSSSIGSIGDLLKEKMSSFERRPARADEEGRALVESRSEQLNRAVENHKIVVVQCEDITKRTTAKCFKVKKQFDEANQMEHELKGLRETAATIKQISIQVDHVQSKLVDVERLLKQVSVLDVSVQHLRWEKRLERDLNNFRKKQKQALAVKKGKQRVEKVTSGFRSDMSRFFRAVSSDGPRSVSPSEQAGGAPKTSDLVEPGSAVASTGTASPGGSKAGGPIVEEGTGGQAASGGEEQEEESDDDFDPTSLYNEE